MTCEETQSQLDAYADRELGWGAAWGVRRHLTGCKACASELAAIRSLLTRVRVWRDSAAPADLHSQIAAALPPFAPRIVRHRSPVRRAAIGLVGVATAAVAFFWFLPGQPGQPTIVYADVERAMEQVQTVSFRYEMKNARKFPREGNVVSFTAVANTNWLRRNPPAIAMIDFETVPAQETDIIKTLIDNRGGFYLSKREALMSPNLKVSAQQRVESQLRSFTEFPLDVSSSKSLFSQAQTIFSNFQHHYVTVNGETLVRFDRDSKTVWPEREGRIPHKLAHAILLANPETHRIVRIEIEVSEDTSFGPLPRRYHIVFDHFLYNQKPPPGVFDWSPPAGTIIKNEP